MGKIGQQIETRLLELVYPGRLKGLYRAPLRVALVYLAAMLVLQVTLAAILGGFSGTRDVVDITETPLYLPGLLALAAAVYYALWLPRALGQTLDALVADGVLAAPRLPRLSIPGWLRFVPYATALAGIAAGLLISQGFQADLTYWNESNPVLALVAWLSWAVGLFAAGGLLVMSVVGIHLLNTIIRHDQVTVFPLHPDGCGGFRPLGRFALRLSYLAVILGIMLIVAALSSIADNRINEDYPLFVLAAGYVIIVPSLFLWPLIAAHHVMTAFRDNLMRDTAVRYLRHDQAIHDSMPPDADALEERLKYLDSLASLRRHEQTFPSWPFDPRIRLSVILNATIPILPALLGLLIDRFA